MVTTGPSAWLFLAYGEDRRHGGNLGYEDDLDRYSFDSHVPNWKRVRAGDIAVIAGRDGRRGPPVPTGIARIERVTAAPGVKVVRRCPRCGQPRFEARHTRAPRFRCNNGHEFDEPTIDNVAITRLAAWYGGTYRDLASTVTPAQLKAAQRHARDVNAIRPLDVPALRRAIPWDPGLSSVIDGGPQYPSPGVAAEVDRAAMKRAVELAQARYPGLSVEPQHHSNPGFDLRVADGREVVRYIEVKGTTGAVPHFWMSDFELRFAQLHAERYSLLVLARLDLASGECDAHWHDGAVGEEFGLRPIQWQGVFPTESAEGSS